MQKLLEWRALTRLQVLGQALGAAWPAQVRVAMLSAMARGSPNDQRLRISKVSQSMRKYW